MLDILFRLAGTVAYRIVQEYRALDAADVGGSEFVRLGLMDDGTLGPDDPASDVYCGQVGFSASGRLKTDRR